MTLRFFDFEVFPKWWCVVIGDYPEIINDTIPESRKESFWQISSDDANARETLLAYLMEKDVCVVGYNIKGYDLVIANAIYQGFGPEQIYALNECIINPSLQYSDSNHMRMGPFAKKKLRKVIYQDLLDDGTGSLKQKECSLGLSILESSVPFDKTDLTNADKEEILKYCRHDVWSSMKFYEHTVAPYTATKLALGKEFGISEEECHMSTNAKLCAKALGAVRTDFLDQEEIAIELPKKIRDYCVENLPYKILYQLQTDNKAFHVNLFNNEVDFGNGGIHSVYATDIYVESDEEYCLVNVDATSYYPSMLIQFETLSRCVQNPKIFENIYDERIAIKHKKDKTPADQMRQLAYKLVLNTTFGASGNKYLDLFDPYMCTKCCRLGQIYLAALACKITKNISSAIIIQTNTDGILVYLKRLHLDKLKRLMQEWAQVSGIGMEEDYVDKIWQKDVNNYLLIKDDGTIKNKGMWLNNTIEKPGYVMLSPQSAFICSNAAIKWFVNGTDPVETIVACKDLSQFVIACTKGPTFSRVVQRMTDGNEVELYKSNRVIATKDKSYGQLYKVKKYKDKLSYHTMPNTPEHCLVVNEDLSSYDFKEISKQLDYMYYIERTADIINRQFRQLKGSSMTNIDKFIY